MPEVGAHARGAVAVVELARELEALLQQLLRAGEVAQLRDHRAGAVERALAQRRRAVAARERGGHELAALDQAAAPDPVAPGGRAQHQRDRGVAVGRREGDRGADVVAVGVHPVQPLAHRGALEPALGVLEDLAEMPRVGAPGVVEPAAGLEQVVGVLAHGLEHREAPVAARQQAVLDQRGETVERVQAADRLGGLEREAADEHAEPLERGLRGRVEQVVAPADRRPQRLLARAARRVSPRSGGPAACSSRSRIAAGAEDLRARGGELDRQRQAVQARADLARSARRRRVGARGAD